MIIPPIMKYFEYEHLTNGDLRDISYLCSTFADIMNVSLKDSAEKSAGLRKLLEAKDCFVRAALDGVNQVKQ